MVIISLMNEAKVIEARKIAKNPSCVIVPTDLYALE